MNEIVDARQRQQALDPHESFAVTAPAGSGKTELLTQRVLRLLSEVEKPEEILAITFTRKAANEMRHRILQALQRARRIDSLDNLPHHEKHTLALARSALANERERNWQLLQTPSRLRIQTIDSFAMSLVTSMPLTAGIGAQVAITDNPEPYYRQAIRQLFKQLQYGGAIGDDLKLLIGHFDNHSERLEQLLITILSRREQWLRHLSGSQYDLSGLKSYLENVLQCLVRETLEQTRAALAPWAAQLIQCAADAGERLRLESPDAAICRCAGMSELPACDAQGLRQWQALVDLLLTGQGGWRKRLTKNEGFPSATKEPEKSRFKSAKDEAQSLIEQLQSSPLILEKLTELRLLPQPEYAPEQWRMLGVLSRLLPVLVAELLLVFRDHGEVDYSQISHAAAGALSLQDQPTDLALILDYQIRHILIDEFQDTSSAQFEMLSRLIAEWTPGDGRSLFIVGDGMQSCYGFRDANVGLLLRARRYGIANTRLRNLDLSTNFRSSDAIVAWINNTFSRAFPETEELSRGAVPYSPSVALKENTLSDAPVAFYACLEDATARLEAERVVALTQQSLETTGDSIAILVRSRSHLSAIIPALQLAGIAWSALDIDPLERRPIITDLMSLTRALCNPGDRLAWLALLRAPWSGLSLADLQQVADGAVPVRVQSIWSALCDARVQQKLSEPGRVIVRRLLEILLPAIDKRQRYPLARWIEGVWLALGGPCHAYSNHDLAQVPAFFELLRQHQNAGSLDMSALQDSLKKLYAKPDEALSRVQIMTIHKAKGLEFDHVILPGLERSNPADDKALLLWHERLSAQGQAQLLISPVAAKGASDDPIYQYIKNEQDIKNRLENTRLIYVAATRAIKRLSLLARMQLQEDGSFKSPAGNSLLAPIWADLESQAIRLSGTGAEQPHASAAALQRLAPQWRSPAQDAEEGIEEDAAQDKQVREHPAQTNPDKKTTRPARSKVDWLELERSNRAALTVSDQALSYFKQLLPAFVNRIHETSADTLSPLVRQLVSQQCPSRLVEDVCGRITQAIRAMHGDETARWLFSRPEARINWALSKYDAQQLSRIEVPLAFYAGERFWLVDFELEALGAAGAERKDLLLARKRAYFKLLAGAARSLADAPLQLALYFPLARHLEPIDIPG